MGTDGVEGPNELLSLSLEEVHLLQRDLLRAGLLGRGGRELPLELNVLPVLLHQGPLHLPELRGAQSLYLVQGVAELLNFLVLLLQGLLKQLVVLNCDEEDESAHIERARRCSGEGKEGQGRLRELTFLSLSNS